ncbi:uncharacterized protein LOC141584251 [Saimiri boliviensis]|uniref:uncharacterized protein LOC141584251 n=1 Tax=Saimiri boliviensis TaxID=27679 RepID=UPI003D77B025
MLSVKKSKIRLWLLAEFLELCSVLPALSLPLRARELFKCSKSPDGLPWSHSPGCPRSPQLRDRGLPSLGDSNRCGQRRVEQLPASWWAALEPCGELPPSACALPSPRKGPELKYHPALGELGRGWGKRGGAVESQASGSRSSGLPPRPGDTRGTPGLRRTVNPVCVDWCASSREVPRAPRCQGATNDCGAGPAPGAPPRGGLPAERGPRADSPGRPSPRTPRSPAESPGRRGPQRSSPPPGSAAALPGAE